MSRLPVVGGDINTWGTVLNDFLGVSFNSDGTLKSSANPELFNVVDYGAALDGTTDDSGAIQDAIDAAAELGGGIVLIPGRVFTPGATVKINTTLDMRSGVWLRGLGSCTSLSGTANPMIQIKQVADQDRITISDLFLQSPAGSGIKVVHSGAYQLGWPRLTIENITIADATTHGFWLSPFVIECRLLNCVSMRAGGNGFYIQETDNIVIGCTSAESTGDGFNISGGNNKLTACKSYGNDGYGFDIGGAGRHVLSGCEAQDNGPAGYRVNSEWNTLAACLADSNNLAGVEFTGPHNSVDGSFMYGGGGSGQVTKAGVLFRESATDNVVRGVSNCPAPVGGKAAGNTVYVKAGPSSRKEITYTTPWTPNAYDAEIQAMTLTGDLTLVNPVYKHVGQQLTLELRQDGSGGHAVTFPDQFRASWSPVTTADYLNVVAFEYDGTAWQQTGSVVGLTPKPSIARGDTFNRADEVLNVSSSGHTWEKYNQGGGVWNVVSNQAKTVGSGASQTNIAVLDALVPDYTAQVTIVTHANLAGIVWHYTDSSNYYLVAGNTMFKIVAGVQVGITSGTFNFVSGDVMKVVTSGPNHFIYQNGTLVYTFADTFNISATKVGISAGADTDILDAFTIA